MQRRKFLSLFGSTAVAVCLAPMSIASATTIAIKEYQWRSIGTMRVTLEVCDDGSVVVDGNEWKIEPAKP